MNIKSSFFFFSSLPSECIHHFWPRPTYSFRSLKVWPTWTWWGSVPDTTTLFIWKTQHGPPKKKKKLALLYSSIMSGNLALYSFKVVLNDHWKEDQKLVKLGRERLLLHDQQTKTNSPKRLLGIFDFPPIYMNCLLSKNIFILQVFSKTRVYNFIYQYSCRK